MPSKSNYVGKLYRISAICGINSFCSPYKIKIFSKGCPLYLIKEISTEPRYASYLEVDIFYIPCFASTNIMQPQNLESIVFSLV